MSDDVTQQVNNELKAPLEKFAILLDASSDIAACA